MNNKITSLLWLGNEFDAANKEFLVKNDISAILNVAASQCPPHFATEVSAYARIELSEQTNADQVRDVFERCFDFIGKFILILIYSSLLYYYLLFKYFPFFFFQFFQKILFYYFYSSFFFFH